MAKKGLPPVPGHVGSLCTFGYAHSLGLSGQESLPCLPQGRSLYPELHVELSRCVTPVEASHCGQAVDLFSSRALRST